MLKPGVAVSLMRSRRDPTSLVERGDVSSCGRGVEEHWVGKSQSMVREDMAVVRETLDVEGAEVKADSGMARTALFQKSSLRTQQVMSC